MIELKKVTIKREKELSEVYNWIEKNQNKAISLSFLAGSISIDAEMKEGYTISNDSGLDDIELLDNKTQNIYHIMLFDTDFSYTVDKKKMETEADFQLETKDALILFNLD